MTTTTPDELKDYDIVQEVILSRIKVLEGPDFEYSRLKQFQRSLFELISADKISEDELDDRCNDLLLTLCQMRTSTKADLMRIQKLEAEGHQLKAQVATLEGKIKEIHRKRPTAEQERNELMIEALETLLSRTAGRSSLNSRISQLQNDIAQLKVQERVLKKFERKTKRDLAPFVTLDLKTRLKESLAQLEIVTNDDYLVDHDFVRDSFSEEPLGLEVGDELLDTLMVKGNEFLGTWSPSNELGNISFESQKEDKREGGRDDETSSLISDSIWSVEIDLTL